MDDYVEGLADFGKFGRKKEPADHALVLMLRKLGSNWIAESISREFVPRPRQEDMTHLRRQMTEELLKGVLDQETTVSTRPAAVKEVFILIVYFIFV